jgi:hypothetical protein
MKKEWFSTNELAGIDGLPSTKQGINQKARREQWATRKRSGVQGKAVEYHIDSLPSRAQDVLKAHEDSAAYVDGKDNLLSIWITAYHQLTSDERDRLITFIMRHGVAKLVHLIDKGVEVDMEN